MITAEFAEDAATVDLLRDMGVDFAQGYAIARAVPTAGTPSGMQPPVAYAAADLTTG